MWVSFGFNQSLITACRDWHWVSVPYVGELRIQFDPRLPVPQREYVSVPYVGELRIQFGIYHSKSGLSDVSVPYVGELRIQYPAMGAPLSSIDGFSTLCG